VFGNAEQIFGQPAEQLRGRKFDEIVAPEQRSYWTDRVARVFRGERLSLRKALATPIAACSISMFPVRSPEGMVVLAGGLAQAADDRHVAARLLQAQEAERSRWARLLHDRAGQFLTAAGLQLDLLHMELQDNALPQAARTAEIQSTLDLAMEAVRELGQQLSPLGVGRTGLRMALDGLAGRLRSDFHGVVRVLADPAATPPPDAATALFRIAEEAAVNAVRHSGGSAIEILLKATRHGPALEIRDNGQGFRLDDHMAAGMGLVIMEQYAEQAGLDLHIDSRPGHGTVIKAVCRSAHEASAG
jgi:signal transduction histidine kinase